MPKKLTLKQAQEICINNGFKPLFNNYSGNRDKVLVECSCGKRFLTKFNNIQSKQAKSCGHCNDPKIGDKFNSLTIIEIISNNKHGCKVKCKCECGNICGPFKANHVIIGNNKTCGNCNIPKVGDKFNKLIVTKIFLSKNHYNIECLCDCGTIYTPKYPCLVVGGYVKSCGRCYNPNIGDRFGKLVVTKVTLNKHGGGGCAVECMCDCGNMFNPICANLYNGRNKSCGNCDLMVNGIATSHIALELHSLVEKIIIYSCEHNKIINDRYFDIVCEKLKIVIEYDGYYYHRIKRNTTKQEKKDEKLLKQKGYKFLRIRSDGTDIPTEKQLKKILLDDFNNGVKKRTITMKSWTNKVKEFEN